MKKDQYGNIICPKCGQRKYIIRNVFVAEEGVLGFRATCKNCKKRFTYKRPVEKVGVYFKKCNHELEEIRTYRNGEVISVNHQCSICGYIKEGE